MTVGESCSDVWINQCDVPLDSRNSTKKAEWTQMKTTDEADIKKEMATVEQRLYAFKDRVEMMVARQVEMERRLRDAEMRAAEADELRQKYEKLEIENSELRDELLQLKKCDKEKTVMFT